MQEELIDVLRLLIFPDEPFTHFFHPVGNLLYIDSDFSLSGQCHRHIVLGVGYADIHFLIIREMWCSVVVIEDINLPVEHVVEQDSHRHPFEDSFL